MLNRSIAASSVFINPVNVLGWVVKSRDPCYSFSVAQYGPQQQAKGDAGNGILTNGTFLSGNWHCFERYGLAENVEWLQHIEQMVGKQAMGKNRQLLLIPPAHLPASPWREALTCALLYVVCVQ